MSDPIEIQRAKIKALTSGFNELGYKTSTKIGQNELSQFLNRRSKTGQFDHILTEKLFNFLELEKTSSMAIDEFISGFLEFEEDLRKNVEIFEIKFIQEQEIYSNILKQCSAYQSEKLNSEGLCENAKIYGEITDIDIRRKLEGIKEIIIIIIYNEKKEELHFKIGDLNSNNENLNRTFQFKPTSRKDHFEFVLQGINDRNQVFDIGSRVFPLDEIDSQEEYLVQIIIPEMDNPNQVAAYIHANIVLYWSDYKHYEKLKKKQEKRLKKYSEAANKAAEYLKMVREIYGDLSEIKPDLIVDFNNEKLMQRKGAKLNVNFNNVLESETGANYLVEFNNKREVQKRSPPLRVEFNNSKEVLSPESHTKNYEYKYNYSSNVNQEIINKTENIINNLKSLQNDLDNFNRKINTNLPNIDDLNSNIEKISIKSTSRIISESKNQNNESNNLKLNNLSEINEENPDELDHQQIVTDDYIIKEENQKYQQITDNASQNSKSQQNLQNSNTNIENNNQNDYKTFIQQTQTTTETTTKNISQPQFISNNTSQEQNNQNNYGQNENKFDNDAFLQKSTTHTQNQIQSQYKNQPQIFNNVGSGGSGFVHEETTETTKTTTTFPVLSQPFPQFNQNNIIPSSNIQNKQDLYTGAISNLRNMNQTTTTTTTKTISSNQNQNISNFTGDEQYKLAQRIGYGTDDGGNINAYQTSGTEMIDNNTNIQNMDPFVNNIQYVTTVNNNIFHSENTLPTSYLPEKVNKVIIDQNVTALPLITTKKTVSYDNFQPIVHDVQAYYTGENSIINNNFNNANEFNISNGGNNYNFISNENLNGNINSNGIIDNNINNYNDFNGNNWYSTTQTTTENNFDQNNLNFETQEI